MGNKCHICGTADRLHAMTIDHDHESHEIRGLLCRLCNTGLGAFRDSPEFLLKAVSYLYARKPALRAVPDRVTREAVLLELSQN